KYGDEFDYIVHLQATESVLRRFGVDESKGIGYEWLLCIAWLHDVLEDTETTYEDLEPFFELTICNIVATLTEPKGGNRKWRHSQTYPRIAQHEMAIVVKLADRIANVEASGSKVGMYRKEHHEFKRTLRALDPAHKAQGNLWWIMEAMWNHLDSLLIPVQGRT